MAGKGVELQVSPTDNNGKLLAAIGQLKVGGKVDFIVSIQIAMLALNHRRNPNGGKRIIVFLGSPLQADPQKLTQLAAQLKKNNFALDVVSMGEAETNTPLLTDFVNAVVNNDNSSLLVVGAGSERPLDEIMQSASLGLGRGRTGGSGVSGGGGGFEGGAAEDDFDESMDPELAMVLRISQEEARAAAEAQSGGATEADSGGAASAAAAAATGGALEDDDDAEFAAAMALSLQSMGGGGAADAGSSAAQDAQPAGGDDMEEDEDDEDADMAAALALSMQSTSTMPPQPPSQAETSGGSTTTGAGAGSGDAAFVDADFVREMLGQVGGDIDPNDPLIAAALAQLGTGNSEEGKDKDTEDTDGGGGSKKRKEPDSK